MTTTTCQLVSFLPKHLLGSIFLSNLSQHFAVKSMLSCRVLKQLQAAGIRISECQIWFRKYSPVCWTRNSRKIRWIVAGRNGFCGLLFPLDVSQFLRSYFLSRNLDSFAFLHMQFSGERFMLFSGQMRLVSRWTLVLLIVYFGVNASHLHIHVFQTFLEGGKL